MLEGICGYDGKTYIVASCCEVIENWNYKARGDEQKFCGKPTTHFYPSMGGGTMPLCSEHAQKHLPHGAWPVGVPALSERAASSAGPETPRSGGRE